MIPNLYALYIYVDALKYHAFHYLEYFLHSKTKSTFIYLLHLEAYSIYTLCIYKFNKISTYKSLLKIKLDASYEKPIYWQWNGAFLQP